MVSFDVVFCFSSEFLAILKVVPSLEAYNYMHFVQVDPSGSYFSWKASAMGKNVSNAKTFLEKRYVIIISRHMELQTVDFLFFIIVNLNL